VHPLDALHAFHVRLKERIEALEDRLDATMNAGRLSESDTESLAEDLRLLQGGMLEHFATEDAALLPVVERRLGRHGGSMVDILWYEHEELRRAVRKFAEALEEASAAPTEATPLQELNRYGLFLVQVLQDHVRKEESAFFPQARESLTDEDWAEVRRRMETPPPP
jgi:hemerythrin-like domain-containing protein